MWDFAGHLVVKNPPFNASNRGLKPGQELRSLVPTYHLTVYQLEETLTVELVHNWRNPLMASRNSTHSR